MNFTALLPSAHFEVVSCVWTCSVVGVAQSALQTTALDNTETLICVCLEETVRVTLSLSLTVNRYDEDRETMDPGFPRIIGESWNGIPDDIDSAFSLNDIGKHLLFLPV